MSVNTPEEATAALARMRDICARVRAEGTSPRLLTELMRLFEGLDALLTRGGSLPQPWDEGQAILDNTQAAVEAHLAREKAGTAEPGEAASVSMAFLNAMWQRAYGHDYDLEEVSSDDAHQ